MDFSLGQFSRLVEKFESLGLFALPISDLADQAVETGVRDIEAKRILGLGGQRAEIGARFVQLAGNFVYQGICVQRVQCQRHTRRSLLKEPT
ncbi:MULTISPECIES: hypothetical protein [unclassified Mesorhizobium]|uniref:hypothetical protein n=1 Tax=unclassified Mesorhizobium TaxID=325217 RepID=UPI001FEE7FB8|nr:MULTISPECIES: hypothetical protein [unclassified Mesorhizobium]MCA0023537.1 hypothetical protein [Mesorhizobium sp. B263B1A]